MPVASLDVLIHSFQRCYNTVQRHGRANPGQVGSQSRNEASAFIASKQSETLITSAGLHSHRYDALNAVKRWQREAIQSVHEIEIEIGKLRRVEYTPSDGVYDDETYRNVSSAKKKLKASTRFVPLLQVIIFLRKRCVNSLRLC